MTRSVRAFLPLLLAAAAATGCRDVSSSASDVTTYEILQQSTELDDFRAALISTQTAALLQGSERYTVFAPTDAAFAALPQATRDAISSDPQKLRAVVRYHLVSGRHTSSTLTEGRTLATVHGADLTFSRNAGVPRVNGADFVLRDLAAVNGVVHMVDTVLIPPGVL